MTAKKTEKCLRIDGPRDVSKVAVEAIAKRLQKTVLASTGAIVEAARPHIEHALAHWKVNAEKQIAAVMVEAANAALAGWKRDSAQVQRNVVRAMLRAGTETKMIAWAEAAASQIEAEVDGRNLIDTAILESLKWKRAARKDEHGGLCDTDGLKSTDEEFLAWYVGQIGETGISSTNRLALRLLLIAALDWIRDERDHWREPRLGEMEVFKKQAGEA